MSEFTTRSPTSIVPFMQEFTTRSPTSIVPFMQEFTTRSPTSIVPFIPEFDPPLLPGEQIHIGYTPVTETYAFELGYKENPYYIAKTTVEFARGKMNSDRIISLIRKFVWFNDANFVVPKQEYLRKLYTPKLAIYESTVLYVGPDHTVRIGFAIYAVRGAEDRLVIEVNRLKGDSTTFHEFYRSIKMYLESDGIYPPRIQKTRLPSDYSDSRSALSANTLEFATRYPISASESIVPRIPDSLDMRKCADDYSDSRSRFIDVVGSANTQEFTDAYYRDLEKGTVIDAPVTMFSGEMADPLDLV